MGLWAVVRRRRDRLSFGLQAADGGAEGCDVPGRPRPAHRGGPALTFVDVRARAAAAALTGNDSEILALAGEAGAVHGREPQYRLPRDDVPPAFGVSEAGNLAYMVMAR